MKKTIRKPENWQDFESLCKKLWGEIWEISSKIKKNGRLGQPQAGVDVYGKPKGETNYWGIQCKGKDDYTNSKLTKNEIDSEIEKAKLFKPKLDVFIFATTANKDAVIEEYIRIKDIEYQTDFFEILLYSWEDIADLIEENRDTFNWYINEVGFKEKYDFEVYFNDFKKDLEINPKFIKHVKSYKLRDKDNPDLLIDSLNLQSFSHLRISPSVVSLFGESNHVNRAWCKFEVILANTGNKVLEDWKFTMEFIKGVHKINDPYDSILTMISNSKSINTRTTYVFNEEKYIRYFPNENEPLIQKDNKYFEVKILPEKYEEEIVIKWSILARDFSKTGELFIKIKPDFTIKENIIEVDDESGIIEDEIEIMYLVEEKKNNA